MEKCNIENESFTETNERTKGARENNREKNEERNAPNKIQQCDTKQKHNNLRSRYITRCECVLFD